MAVTKISIQYFSHSPLFLYPCQMQSRQSSADLSCARSIFTSCRYTDGLSSIKTAAATKHQIRPFCLPDSRTSVQEIDRKKDIESEKARQM